MVTACSEFAFPRLGEIGLINRVLGGALFGALALSANAATYYVDNSGASPASDAPTHGSEMQPWRTISYALTRLAGGDTVLVKNGLYQEDGLYIFGPSGTATKDTRLMAFPGHSPRIRGPGNTGRIAIDGAAYFTIVGFDISNLNHCLVIRNGAHHITIQDCNIHDSGNELVRVFGDCYDILLAHNSVHDGGALGGANGEGFYIGTSGERDNTNHVTVRGNTIYNTASEGIELKPGTHDCLVEGNNVRMSNTGIVPAACIELDETQFYTANPRHVVRNNIVHDAGSGSHGIRAGTGCTVYNNVIYGISRGKFGIIVDNRESDLFLRKIYHNTIDAGSDRAVSLRATPYDIRNNIGPALIGNTATNAAFFVNAAGHDYHLLAGSPPIDAGVDLSRVVAVDFDGTFRPNGQAGDLGAYEYSTVQK